MPDGTILDMLDNVRHFDTLDLAEKFMSSRGPRAIGFFSSVDSTEHTVFLTVAKQLAEQKDASPLLGRTTVGRGTKGCIIYLVPDAKVRTRGGAEVVPLIELKLMLPESAEHHSLPEYWRELGRPLPTTAEEPAPSNEQMWEAVLETEALILHHFLQAGTMQPVHQLTATSVEPLTASAAALGLLVLPQDASTSVHDYHMRRLRKLAASYPRWLCDGEQPDPDPVWLGKMPRCTAAPPNATMQFAFARTSSDESSRLLDGMLLAGLGNKLGLEATALPQPGREARFVLLTRKAKKKGKHVSTAWRARVLDGAATAAGIDAFCEQHLPWRSVRPAREAKGELR
tara:strand:- start:98 stop:1123 length:1026 start_codon:yes stop_codon:yes gene_type:complete